MFKSFLFLLFSSLFIFASTINPLPSSTLVDKSHWDYKWYQLTIHDQSVPLTVDIVTNKNCISKLVFLIPANGMNFTSSYFFDNDTTTNESLTKYLLKNNCMVVGINPREDNLQPLQSIDSTIKNWGYDFHAKDINKIISYIKSIYPMPYVIAGHSFGGALALHAASIKKDPCCKKIVVLDLYNPNMNDPNISQLFSLFSNTFDTLIEYNQYADNFVNTFKYTLPLYYDAPNLDTGFPRSYFGYDSTFTMKNFIGFSLINSNVIPDQTTPFTGMNNNWTLQKGLVSGTYTMQADPLQDTFTLDYLSIDKISTIMNYTNAGVCPNKMYVDFYNNVTDFSKIYSPVVWINTAGGYDTNFYAAKNIIPKASTYVVPNLGHMDILINNPNNIWSLIIK